MSNFEKFHERIINGGKYKDNLIALSMDVEGMCDLDTLSILNYGVSECLDETESYFEIGTWNGRTAIAALLDNTKTATVIDPLVYDNSATDFYKNISNWNVFDRIKMYQFDWQKCFDFITFDKPIGLHFFDGDHGDLSTFSAFEAFIPFYSDKCILIADDYCMNPVKRDMELFKTKYKDNIKFQGVLLHGNHQYVMGFQK